MSLYIGDSNYGKKIMHITSDQMSKNAIASHPGSTTVFHSDLPYFQPERFACGFHTRTDRYGERYHYFNPDNAAIGLISQGYEFIILVKTANSKSKFVNATSFIYMAMYADNTHNGLRSYPTSWGPDTNFQNGATLPSSTNKWLSIAYKYGDGGVGSDATGHDLLNSTDVIYEASILVINIKNGILTAPIGKSFDNASSIRISPSEFKITTSSSIYDFSNFTSLTEGSYYDNANGFVASGGCSKHFLVDTSKEPSYGWRLYPSGVDSSYRIDKKISNGQYKNVFSSANKLSTYTGEINSSIGPISFGKGTNTYNIVSIPVGAFAFVDVSGYLGMRTFSPTYFINKGIICGNNDNQYTAVIVGDNHTYRDNGVNKHSIVTLSIGVIGDVLMAKIVHKRGYAGSGGLNTFNFPSINFKVKIFQK